MPIFWFLVKVLGKAEFLVPAPAFKIFGSSSVKNSAPGSASTFQNFGSSPISGAGAFPNAFKEWLMRILTNSIIFLQKLSFLSGIKIEISKMTEFFKILSDLFQSWQLILLTFWCWISIFSSSNSRLQYLRDEGKSLTLWPAKSPTHQHHGFCGFFFFLPIFVVQWRIFWKFECVV